MERQPGPTTYQLMDASIAQESHCPKACPDSSVACQKGRYHPLWARCRAAGLDKMSKARQAGWEHHGRCHHLPENEKEQQGCRPGQPALYNQVIMVDKVALMCPCRQQGQRPGCRSEQPGPEEQPATTTARQMYQVSLSFASALCHAPS